MNIHVQIWISDVNDKVENITPDDCTLYENEFADAKALSSFILGRLKDSETNHGVVEQMLFSIDDGRVINAYKLDDTDIGIDQWNFEEGDVQQLIDDYRILMTKERASIED